MNKDNKLGKYTGIHIEIYGGIGEGLVSDKREKEKYSIFGYVIEKKIITVLQIITVTLFNPT